MNLLRQYEPWEAGEDGYPWAWHHSTAYGAYPAGHSLANPAVKDLIRMQADHRCLRCRHPYPPGISKTHPRGEWTPCDERCVHMGPVRWVYTDGVVSDEITDPLTIGTTLGEPGEKRLSIFKLAEFRPEAHWFILTVHHLDEDKLNCRWWNLAALCQRCHLRMQRAVVMGRPYHYEHSDWFKPYAAGFYAWKYLGEDLERAETLERLPELLALEHRFTQEVLL